VWTECEHTQELTSDWLRKISDRYNKGIALGTLTERTLFRLVCSVCGSRFVDVQPHDASVTMLGRNAISEADIEIELEPKFDFDDVRLKWTIPPPVERELCGVCNGSGGERDVCLKCWGFGTIPKRNAGGRD
jgi:hypothetical protein